MPAPALRRRPTTIALLVLAGVSLLLVTAALWNPWRLTALHPLASTGGAVVTLTLTGALLAASGLLMVADSARRALIGVVVALVAVPVVGVGLPVATLGDAFRDQRISTERVLATSPGEGYSVVAVTYSGGTTELLVRSRRGLLSREGVQPLGWCAADPFAAGLPPESVHFTDEHRVAVPVAGEGATVTVAFDGDTLRPERTIDMCAG